MVITPDGNVTLYNNVPLQSDYKITYWFDTKANQTSFFNSFTKVELMPNSADAYRSKFSYIKRSAGVLRVECNTNKLLNCSYMSFTNSGINNSTQQFENKTYYCFVNSVEYVNNTTSDIYYSIDLIQTYLFDISLKESFIVRQHSETDEMYENLQPENLAIGEYVSEYQTPIIPNLTRTIAENVTIDGWVILVWYTDKVLTNDLLQTALGEDYATFVREPDGYSGIYQGASCLVLPFNSYYCRALKLLLFELSVASFNGIINVQLAPAIAIPNSRESSESASDFTNRQHNFYSSVWTKNGVTETLKAKYNDSSNTDIFNNSKFGNYRPLNNKLYTYPYCFLYATNFRGDNEQLKYEYFTYDNDHYPHQISLRVECNFSIQPQAMLQYLNYKNCLHSDNYLIIDSFPICSWHQSALVDWLAKAAMLGIGAMTSDTGTYATLSSGVGGVYTHEQNVKKEPKKEISRPPYLHEPLQLTGNVPENIEDNNETDVITDRLGGYIKLPNPMGDKTHGTSSGDILFGTDDMKLFGLYKMEIREEYAIRIDKFFSRYGYAQNKFAIPNIHARSNWTYIETEGCFIVGNNMQSEHERNIEKIFNNGITFWAYNGTSSFGDFSHPENNTVLGNQSQEVGDNNG